MARRSPLQHMTCFLIIILPVTTFVPLQTDAGLEALFTPAEVTLGLGLMHAAKSAVEFFTEKPFNKKLSAVVGEYQQNYDLLYRDWSREFRQRVIGDGDGGNGTRVHHIMRTGTAGDDDNRRKLPVLAVDVANMFSWTTRCDFATPGLWLVSCNSPLCQRNAASPPYCKADGDDDSSCDPQSTWGLFNASLARYLDRAAEPEQARAPVWYFCISTDEGAGFPDAVLGLGRGPPGTLPATFTRFSYILTPSGHTSVWLGDGDSASAPAPGEEPQLGRSAFTTTTTTIPLISNPNHPELYYVGLKSIRVDGTELDLGLHPGILQLDPDNGTGGVFMSSTPVQPWTYLNRAAYQKLVDKFIDLLRPAKPVPGPEPGQLCYWGSSLANTPTTTIPKLALVFDDGAVMELRKDNYWGQYINGLQCLAILPSPWTTGESMLGSQLQWGWRMAYDLDNSVLRATAISTTEDAPAPSTPPQFAPPTSAATRLRILPLL